MRLRDGAEHPRGQNHVADAIVAQEEHAIRTRAPIRPLAPRALAHDARDRASHATPPESLQTFEDTHARRTLTYHVRRTVTSDFPVGEHQAALGASLLVSRERHAQIGPAHASPQRNEALIGIVVV